MVSRGFRPFDGAAGTAGLPGSTRSPWRFAAGAPALPRLVPRGVNPPRVRPPRRLSPSTAMFPHGDRMHRSHLGSTGERARDSLPRLAPPSASQSEPPGGPGREEAPPQSPLSRSASRPPLLLVVAVVAVVPSRRSENPACFRRARPLLSPPSPRKGGCGKVRCPARHDNRRADFLASGPKRPHLTAENRHFCWSGR